VIFHEHAHDSSLIEKRGDIIETRGLRVRSNKFHIIGQCDVVEFHSSREGVHIKHYDGLWIPYPIEYKRGKPKSIDADRMQLCAETLCLEEMMCCKISEGALFYGEIKRREIVEISDDLRDSTIVAIGEMQSYFKRGYVPTTEFSKKCKQCSLSDICMPGIKSNYPIKEYLSRVKEK
jgi:CRISPR-associated exonuclease Cas4